MIKKATKEWLKRKKIVAVKLFSESVAEGTFNSWEEWVDDCDFDFILYSTGQEQGDVGIYLENQAPNYPLASIKVEDDTAKRDFRTILEEAEAIIGHNIMKVEIPILEKAFDLELQEKAFDLMKVGKDATAKTYGDMGQRLTLEEIAKNNGGNQFYYAQHLHSAIIRLQEWRRGGHRVVLRSIARDISMIANAAHYIWAKQELTFQHKETGKRWTETVSLTLGG